MDAPGDKKLKGQLGWLVRQLQHAPDAMEVEAFAKNARQPATATLEHLRTDTSGLAEELGKREIHRFRILSRSDLGMNRKAGRKPGFVQSVSASVEMFYGTVLQDLVPYQRGAPRLAPRSETPLDLTNDESHRSTSEASPTSDVAAPTLTSQTSGGLPAPQAAIPDQKHEPTVTTAVVEN